MSPRRQVILLRGINVGAANRLAMPALRQALEAEGFADVRTYLQSGNAVVTHAASPAWLAAETSRVLDERFGLQIPVLVRTQEELAAIVERNPFGDIARREPKLVQVTFLSQVPSPAAVTELMAFADATQEKFAAAGHEVYGWHPGGIHASKLAARLTHKRLGVDIATARNWTTVVTLLNMSANDV